MTRRRRTATWLAGIATVLLAVVLIPNGGMKTAHAASATVSVDAASQGINQSVLTTQLSSQLVWAGMLDGAPNGPAHFHTVEGGNIVRIHAGDDGTTPASAPEQTYLSWDFTSLDELVGDVYTAGAVPMLNIKFPPDWQWTCSTPDTGQTGQVRDQTYQQFAQYMVRILDYYNKGSFTDEKGVVHTNPAGTAHKIPYWEIWNEPEFSIETPCVPPASLDPNGEALTSDQYVTMWNTVVPAMAAQDSTIKFIGPTNANPITGEVPEYVPDLLAHATHEPDFLSFHAYGGWSGSQTDMEILQGSANTDGLDGQAGTDFAQVKSWDTINVPIWITESNADADWGCDVRNTNAYGVAYTASEFASYARDGAGVINQYDFVDCPGFGLIADADYTGWPAGSTYPVYWANLLLHQDFPQGSTILSSSSSLSPGVDALAIKRGDGSVAVLLSNRQPNNSTVINGSGLGGTITVNLSNFTPTSVSLTQIDATTNASSGPTTVSEPVSDSQSVTFGGYGMAVLIFSGTTNNGTPTPTVAPTATATPTNTPTPSPTPSPPPSGAITNGDFGTCNLTGWTFSGAAESLSSTTYHTAACGLVLGVVNGTSNGASKVTQSFIAPSGVSTLILWYNAHNPQINDVPYDYTLVSITNTTTGVSTQLLKLAPQDGGGTWTKLSWASVVPGDSYTLTLENYSSNSSGDVYWTVFDDVSLS